MPKLIEIRQCEPTQFFPSYLNGILKKYQLGSSSGKRFITLELYTEHDWEVVDRKCFEDYLEDIPGARKLADDYIRTLEI